MGSPYKAEEAVAYGRPGGSQSPPQRFFSSDQGPWRIPGASREREAALLLQRWARREGEGKASTRRQTKEKMKQMEKHLKGMAVGAGYLKSKRNKASGREGK